MFIYIFTILSLFIFSLVEVFGKNDQIKKNLFFLSYILLVFVTGFRWETGTDWEPYKETFELVNSFQDAAFFTLMEKGYLFLIGFVKLFTENYTIFLIIHAIIYYFLLIKSIPRLVTHPQLAILLFFCSTMGMMGSNRQLLALGLCFLALVYLLEKKKWLFFIFVFLGSLFHTTALLFLIFFFFNRKFKTPILYISVIVAIIIGYSPIPLKIFSLFGGLNELTSAKTSIYLESAKEALQDAQLSILGLIKRLLFLVVFIWIREKISKKLPSYNLLLNGYVFGVIFYFLFSQSLLVMISRGSFYFNAMEPLLLSSTLLLVRRDFNKLIVLFVMLVLSFIIFFQSISAYPDLFIPYKGIFINEGFYRFLY